MLWIIALMILVLNEYRSGEKWFSGVLKGLALLSVLLTAAVFFTGQIMTISVFTLAAVTAGELYRNDLRRNTARKRLDELNATINRKRLFFGTKKISHELKNSDELVA